MKNIYFRAGNFLRSNLPEFVCSPLNTRIKINKDNFESIPNLEFFADANFWTDGMWKGHCVSGPERGPA